MITLPTFLAPIISTIPPKLARPELAAAAIPLMSFSAKEKASRLIECRDWFSRFSLFAQRKILINFFSKYCSIIFTLIKKKLLGQGDERLNVTVSGTAAIVSFAAFRQLNLEISRIVVTDNVEQKVLNNSLVNANIQEDTVTYLVQNLEPSLYYKFEVQVFFMINDELYNASLTRWKKTLGSCLLLNFNFIKLYMVVVMSNFNLR